MLGRQEYGRQCRISLNSTLTCIYSPTNSYYFLLVILYSRQDAMFSSLVKAGKFFSILQGKIKLV